MDASKRNGYAIAFRKRMRAGHSVQGFAPLETSEDHWAAAQAATDQAREQVLASRHPMHMLA